ncbi:ethanolamine utilization protein [Photobacterium gaetbulicola]|uniref:Putative ethanolamine utilization protein n=1 Tax=Photobacterium gaetbulicola Gung47 TaxID=658445 RepID=A0A0C5WV53_9GAMM|nr:EutP/PduV family microcompartment system protein [Photobacterium gaetbulicola]AJR08954.1 putative ethanolamine utilization protein [Photobacterium gaetbulicola Gung47]PSU13510.1 ethanolamine utilization protein [Photobacterium gaetbulicola]
MNNQQISNIAFIGEVDAGKSALINKLLNTDTNTGKTQAAIFYQGSVIDTPGEFVDNRSWSGALLSTISTVKTIVILQPADAKRVSAPSGLLRVYPNKNIVAVISKSDVEGADCGRAEHLLRAEGVAGPYFRTSIYDGSSIEQLHEHLLSLQPVSAE